MCQVSHNALQDKSHETLHSVTASKCTKLVDGVWGMRLNTYQTIGDLVSKETVCCVDGKVKH